MGRKRKTSGPKPEKKTAIKIRPVLRKQNGQVTEPYAILDRLLAKEPAFIPIRHCRIKMWWQKDWKADADGIVTGATVCKATELDRNLVEEAKGETPDVFIRLPEKLWAEYSAAKKEQVLFHELCHVHPAKDANGEQRRDAKDRPLWRMGRHPITTFHEELAKYGAEAVIGSNQAVLDAMRRADAPLLAEAEKQAAAATK